MSKKSVSPSNPKLRNSLSTATAIAFSLTFLGAGIAAVAGLLPPRSLVGIGDVDTGVIMLMVPLGALMLAIMVEVIRSIIKDGLKPAKPARPASNPLSAWKPGHGEG